MIAEILLIVLSGVAAVFDLEYRKIPNLVIASLRNYCSPKPI